MRPFYHLETLPSLSMVLFKFLTYIKKQQKIFLLLLCYSFI